MNKEKCTDCKHLKKNWLGVKKCNVEGWSQSIENSQDGWVFCQWGLWKLFEPVCKFEKKK